MRRDNRVRHEAVPIGDHCCFSDQVTLLKQSLAERLFSRYPIHPCSTEYWRTFRDSLARLTFSLKNDLYFYGPVVAVAPSAMHMSAFGVKADMRQVRCTWGWCGTMSALVPKADNLHAARFLFCRCSSNHAAYARFAAFYQR